MRLVSLLTALALVAPVGCKKKKTEPPKTSKPAPAPAPAPTPKPPPKPVAKPTPPKPKPKPEAPRFTQFPVPSVPLPYRPGERVWAAYPSKGFKSWAYRQVQFKKAVGDHAQVWSMGTTLTPAAFVSKVEPPTKLKKGQAVLADIGLYSQPARVKKVDRAKKMATITYCTVTGYIGTKAYPLRSLRVLPRREMVPGTYVTYADGDRKVVGQLVYDSPSKAYIIGRRGKLVEKDKKDVKLVNLRPLRKGAKVWARPTSGFAGTLVYQPARVTKVTKGAVGYEVKAEKGKRRWDVCFAEVAPR